MVKDHNHDHGNDNRGSASVVHAVTPNLSRSDCRAFGTHGEEAEAEVGEGQKEEGGKGPMYGPDIELGLCLAGIGSGWKKGHAERANAGEDSGDLIFNIVSPATEHEHGHGTEAADKDISRPCVVVTANRGFEDVIPEKIPGEGDGEGKEEGDETDHFPHGKVGERDWIFRSRREAHRTPPRRR